MTVLIGDQAILAERDCQRFDLSGTCPIGLLCEGEIACVDVQDRLDDWSDPLICEERAEPKPDGSACER
jgi:hypothetical protein